MARTRCRGPNVQLFVRAGDAVLGIYLADTHFQEPPEEDIVGLPRVALAVAPAGSRPAG